MTMIGVEPQASAPADERRETTAQQEYHEDPPYVRPVPTVRFGLAALVATLVFVLGLGAWEMHWRQQGAAPAALNSDGLWAMQRRRIDRGEGDATVLIGSSRMLFDLQLAVWERLDGRRPIQLALEGSSSLPFLEDLAADTAFKGRLLVGVTPGIFFNVPTAGRRAKALTYPQKETPSQWAGQRLSMTLLEPRFAFVDPDFALFTVLKRQAWPARDGVRNSLEVRKLSVSDFDRATHMWSRVETDTVYRDLTRRIWAQNFNRPASEPEAARNGRRDAIIARAAKAVATLRARGVPVIFIRFPSGGGMLDNERRFWPRESTWDVLLARSGAPGVHYEDEPTLRDYTTPEWSHLSAADADRFTAALHGVIVARNLQGWAPAVR